MSTYIEKDIDNGAEIETPDFVNNSSMENNLTRLELEELTNKELAKLAHPKQKTNYSISTLAGKSKTYLIDIILDINQEDKKEQPKGRAAQTSSESEDILNVALGLLQGFKQQREGENAQLNPLATQMFKDSAITQVDKARADGVLKVDKFNTAILGLSAAALVVDGVIGFKNVPGLFSKLKSKLAKKAS